MTRRWSALLAVAVVPWALACLLTVAFGLFSGGADTAHQMLHDFFLTPNVLVPLVAFIACLAVIVLFKRRESVSGRRHWLVGGLLALACTVAAAVLGLAWGGAYVFYWLLAWSVLSGYWAFVWLTGAYVWKSLGVAARQKISV
jgi:hypothetical protein